MMMKAKKKAKRARKVDRFPAVVPEPIRAVVIADVAGVVMRFGVVTAFRIERTTRDESGAPSWSASIEWREAGRDRRADANLDNWMVACGVVLAAFSSAVKDVASRDCFGDLESIRERLAAR